MSFVELIPTVRALSRSDKLRLIQWIAGDLAGTEADPSAPDVPIAGPVGVDAEDPGQAARSSFDRVWSQLVESGHSLPVRFPDESYEAEAILSRLMDEEKSAP